MKPEKVDKLEKRLHDNGFVSFGIQEIINSWRKQRKALEFYADEKNYQEKITFSNGYWVYRIEHDRGQRARDALGELNAH